MVELVEIHRLQADTAREYICVSNFSPNYKCWEPLQQKTSGRSLKSIYVMNWMYDCREII